MLGTSGTQAYIVMAYVVMACIVVAYIVMADIAMAYIVMARCAGYAWHAVCRTLAPLAWAGIGAENKASRIFRFPPKFYFVAFLA